MFIIEQKQSAFRPFALHVTNEDDYVALVEILAAAAFEIGQGKDDHTENLLLKAEKILSMVEESQK